MRVGRSPIANLVVGEDARAASDIFHCQSDSVQTFEFACTSLMCHLDFWQDRFEPLLGVFFLLRSFLWDICSHALPFSGLFNAISIQVELLMW